MNILKQTILDKNNAHIEELTLSESINDGYVIPKNKEHLKKLILDEIKDNGYDCDLNHIDVSQITDMSELFSDDKFNLFNGNISKWNTCNVTNMSWMFRTSQFNSDISKWNTKKVNTMNAMFAD